MAFGGDGGGSIGAHFANENDNMTTSNGMIVVYNIPGCLPTCVCVHKIVVSIWMVFAMLSKQNQLHLGAK